jgi:hypothetical protein
LKAVLKYALKAHGLRCLLLAPEPHRPDAADAGLDRPVAAEAPDEPSGARGAIRRCNDKAALPDAR